MLFLDPALRLLAGALVALEAELEGLGSLEALGSPEVELVERGSLAQLASLVDSLE